MMWRRARKGERCGYCSNHIFSGGEPVLLVHRALSLPRCAPVAKQRYGEDVPDPFPEALAPQLPPRPPAFATARQRHPRLPVADVKSKQAGEQE